MTKRRQALASALARLREVLAQPENDVSRDAAIQRFEFCFELAWKAIQERARDEGMDCQSPKSCLKLAFKNSWILDEPAWLAMLVDRKPRIPTMKPSPRRFTTACAVTCHCSKC